MNVLHVISSIDPRAGGPTTALVGLAPAQRRAGLSVRVVATRRADEDPSPTVGKLEPHDIPVRVVGPTTGPLGGHAELTPALRDAIEWADVVHIHALWEEIQHRAAVECRRLEKPYLFRPCGMLDPWSLSQSKWKKRLYLALRLRRDLNAAAAIHYTAQLEGDLASPLNLKPPPLVEPNGVNLAEFETLPTPGTFRAKHPELAGKRYVVFLSRVHPKKGLDLLIPAFARANLKDTMLVIAGPADADYRAQLDRTVTDEGLTGRVLFTGMLQGRDRIEALADADLFCLPSYQENFGIAVVEALAAGVPVIVSDPVNIHGEITAAGVGAVVPCKVDPLYREMRKWMTSDTLRESARRAARPMVWDRFDWNKIAARWVDHYRRLAGR